MSTNRDIGRSLIEGRLEQLRDGERKDANDIAALLGNIPLVVRMRRRADELWACIETMRDDDGKP